MQMCAVEFARDVLGIKDAISAEVNPNAANPVIDLMEEQTEHHDKGRDDEAWSLRLQA